MGCMDGALWGWTSWRGVGYPRDAMGEAVPEPEAPIEARARVIDVGLGRMVGRRGDVLVEVVADMILGS